MIKTFKNAELATLIEGKKIRSLPPDIQKRAFTKLLMLNASNAITDLRSPPSNRLETLIGDRKGQYSIRINDKYRICFKWRENDAFDVEIVDYHK